MKDGIHRNGTLRVGWVGNEDGEGACGRNQKRGAEGNRYTSLVNPQRINKMLF